MLLPRFEINAKYLTYQIVETTDICLLYDFACVAKSYSIIAIILTFAGFPNIIYFAAAFEAGPLIYARSTIKTLRKLTGTKACRIRNMFPLHYY